MTEVAFYTVPNGAREAAKTVIENDVLDGTHPVLTVGKSTGGAIGWGKPGDRGTDPMVLPLSLWI